MLETGRAEPAGPAWHPVANEEVVQSHVRVQCSDLEQREDDQDEDEVNLLIRIPNLS